MAKEKELVEDVKNVIPKEGPIDITERVTVTATDKAPYHSKGEKVTCAPALAELMKAKGWAE
jgi:hypothetical protein